jgi:hypothetical protein
LQTIAAIPLKLTSSKIPHRFIFSAFVQQTQALAPIIRTPSFRAWFP